MIEEGFIVYNKKDKEYLQESTGGWINYRSIDKINDATIFNNERYARDAIEDYSLYSRKDFVILRARSIREVELM
jgi:hypothetical protein